MFGLTDKISKMIQESLLESIRGSLESLVISFNNKVVEASDVISKTPKDFNADIFNLMKDFNSNVILPLVGLIVTAIFCLKIIDMVLKKNRMEDISSSDIFKLIIETSLYIYVLEHSFDFVMSIFDISKYLVNESLSMINSNAMNIEDINHLIDKLSTLKNGELFGIAAQAFLMQSTMNILGILILIIVYSRIFEIYLYTSVSSLAFATFGHPEWSSIGKGYVKNLIALGLQSLFIIICLAIYKTLIKNLSFEGENVEFILLQIGFYAGLLGFTIFKSGSFSKSLVSGG